MRVGDVVNLEFKEEHEHGTNKPQWQARVRENGVQYKCVLSDKASLRPSVEHTHFQCKVFFYLGQTKNHKHRIFAVIPLKALPSKGHYAPAPAVQAFAS